LDERHGHGTMVTYSPTTDSDSDSDSSSNKLVVEYEGGWMSSYRHGMGVLKDYSAGTIYKVFFSVIGLFYFILF
jgi:hypothetical protein